MSEHAHHDHHGHSHAHTHVHGANASPNTLWLALTLTLLFAAVESVAGVVSGSLALLGDAGHMLTDGLALLLAALAARYARRPASNQLSFGLGKLEPLAALINSLFMLGIVLFLTYEGIMRLRSPAPIAEKTVMGVAIVGLVVNIIVAWLLSRGEQNLNTRAALLHVFGDLLGSVAALASGVIISLTGWVAADALLTMLICGLILASTLRLIHQTVMALLNSVPEHITLPEVGTALAQLPGVQQVHDLHIWPLTSEQTALSAHLVLKKPEDWPNVLLAAMSLLKQRFQIQHVTLQPELAGTTQLQRLPHPTTRPQARTL